MFTSSKLWFMKKSLLMMVISISTSIMMVFSIEKTILHFDINSFLEIPLCITLMFDFQSLVFISTVSAVSSSIIMYSFFYLEQETSYSKKKFLLTLLIFIFSMFILSMSANSFWLLVGWDGLGISSFCLIIFYQNWKSFSSGMVTFLSNRLGDTFIIVSMVWIAMNQSPDSWVFPSSMIFLSFLMTLGAFSKSAQLPYLFWLPQAMAAPTPVSALVHSSTLVTAGIYLVCRFQPTLNQNITYFFFFISCITVLVAGTSSLVEFDLKKIIALSTLCHISLMMMFSILGETNLSLFHLIMHAFFKSLLFMIAGYVIHCNSNSQDIRLISSPKMDLTFSFPFFISILSMMGFPFLSGFYSKEALLAKSTFSLSSLTMMSMFMINSFFSCAYSTRLTIFLFSKSKKSMILLGENPFKLIMIFSSIFSSILGGMLISSLLPEEESIQPLSMKIILFSFSFLGIMVGILFPMNPKIKLLNPLAELWKSDLSYKILQKHFFLLSNLSMWNMDEKGITKMVTNSISKKSKEFFSSLSELFLKEPFSLMKCSHLLVIVCSLWVF